MKRLLLVLACCLSFQSAYAVDEAASAAPEQEQVNPMQQLDWHMGPASENVAAKGTLKTVQGQAFLDEANSRKFLELTGNLPESGNFILVSTESNWWATFSFDDSGYVKDDEKIDAAELLEQLKSYDEPANAERQKLGIPAIYTEGWAVPPHYDAQTKRLEWGLRLRSQDGESVNYTVRILGRTGVMNATLVTDPQSLNADMQQFKAALPHFEFNPGERYSEYKEGDRVAEFGLAALVAGGAAAVATKKGFWAAAAAILAKSGKLILAAVFGVLAWFGSRFRKKD